MLFPEIDLFFHTRKSIKRTLHNDQETVAFGMELGKRIPPRTLLAFFGDLGSGKTTLIKGIVEGFTGEEQACVNSPTFVTLNIYSKKNDQFMSVYHFDLYRLSNYEEFAYQGFEEYFETSGLCCIEWSEKIEGFLPKNHIKIHLNHIFSSPHMREIIIRDN